MLGIKVALCGRRGRGGKDGIGGVGGHGDRGMGRGEDKGNWSELALAFQVTDLGDEHEKPDRYMPPTNR